MQEIFVTIGTWIGAFYIISVYSYLYKDNPLFRFAEVTMIGTAAGHLLVMSINSIIKIGWTGLVSGNYIYLIAFVLGFLLYARFWVNYAWMIRYGMAVVIGSFIGLSVRAEVSTRIIPQLQKTMLPIIAKDLGTSISNIIIIVFTVCATLYFLFVADLTPSEKIFKPIQQIGRLCIVGALGYYLGTTIIVRYAMVINRLEFLFFEWLKIAR
jgi:hypothetical protein